MTSEEQLAQRDNEIQALKNELSARDKRLQELTAEHDKLKEFYHQLWCIGSDVVGDSYAQGYQDKMIKTLEALKKELNRRSYLPALFPDSSGGVDPKKKIVGPWTK